MLPKIDLHMPTGQEDFKQLREDPRLLYVDKTYFIKDWWECSYDKVTLITRPRFFGKTLNLSMIDYFFSTQYVCMSYLFRNLFISYEKDLMNFQGQIPVISLNFSDIKVTDPKSIKSQIKMKIWQVYMIFKKVMNDSPKLDSTEKEFINSITYEMNDDLAIHSIQTLCCFLSKVYDGKASIVLLDDYDSIFTNSLKSDGGIENFFDEIKEFYFGFLQSTFKDNKFMLRGLITGVMNIPIFEDFNGANNIKVYTITSNKYLNCFGFTNEELMKLIEFFKLNDKVDEIEKFYKGYKFGCNTFVCLLNPWSISQYLNDPVRFSNYWFITSSNCFVKEILKNGILNIKDGFIKLIQGKSITEKLSMNIMFSEFFDKSEETMWKILLSSGYLTTEKVSDINENSKLFFTLKIPNNEINVSFCELINEWFEPNGFDLDNFITSLLNENVEEMRTFLLKFLNENSSLFNNDFESVVHAFALGLTVHIKNAFYVKSYKFENDENFYLFLKSLNSEDVENSIILAFNKKENGDDLIKHAESILSNFNKTKMANHLEKKGVEYEKIKKFSLVFTENEIKIHFLSKSVQSISEEEEEEEEIKEKKKKKKTKKNANNSNFLKSIIIEPKFDHKNKNKLCKNKEIYVIDKNGVDIWEAILLNKEKNIYEIHYPDFPEDDERIKGLHRILVRSAKNKRIFEKQEEIRKRIENNNDEKVEPEEKVAEEEEEANDNVQKKEEENSIE